MDFPSRSDRAYLFVRLKMEHLKSIKTRFGVSGEDLGLSDFTLMTLLYNTVKTHDLKQTTVTSRNTPELVAWFERVRGGTGAGKLFATHILASWEENWSEDLWDSLEPLLIVFFP